MLPCVCSHVVRGSSRRRCDRTDSLCSCVCHAHAQKEQAELRRLEEAAALDEKRRRQEEVRMMYDKSLRLKREKEARQLQEQLAFDMKILEQLLEESRNEAMEQQQRKVWAGRRGETCARACANVSKFK